MESTFVLIAIAVVLVGAIVVLALRGERARAESAAQTAQLAQTAERLATAQAELAGRLGQSQADVNQRLDGLTRRLGEGFQQQTEKTGETLRMLHERLAVIDAAQKNISQLSEQVVGLQDILSNKQARGAFGQIQMEDLVRGILPPSAYAFQATLGNGRIADCLLRLPNPPGAIAIDSKFPLESYRALQDAHEEAARERARRAFAADVLKHVRDIAEKYILPGETAESALMFLPSEAVYAELHASLPEVIEKSYRAKVWIVSPTTLMATLNTVRAVLKDARMREQAGLIQQEVRKLLDDVGRLDDRTAKLQRHFDQATEDVRQIRISTEKVSKRAERIEDVQLSDGGDDELAPTPREALGGPE